MCKKAALAHDFQTVLARATCLNIINWTNDSIIINAYMLRIIQFRYLHTRASDIILNVDSSTTRAMVNGRLSISQEARQEMYFCTVFVCSFSSFVGIYMHITSPKKFHARFFFSSRSFLIFILRTWKIKHFHGNFSEVNENFRIFPRNTIYKHLFTHIFPHSSR